MNHLDLWKRLLGYLKPYRIRLFFVVVAAIISTGFMVLAPFVIGLVTTTLFECVKKGVFYWDKIIGLLMILVGLYVISQLFSYFQGLGMTSISANMMKTMRLEIAEKMHRLKLDYYDTHTHGDILSTITNDVDTINNTISQNITSIVTQITTAIGVFIMMMLISPKLSLIPIIMVPLSLLSAAKVMKNSEKYYTQQQDLLGELNGYVEEMYNGQAIVQTFNYQNRAIDNFEQLNQQLKDISRKAETTAGAINPITTLVNDIGYVVCALLGCLGALNGVMSIGNVQAMLEYTWRFADPFATIAGMVGSFSAASAAAKRVFTLLDTKEDAQEMVNENIEFNPQGNVEFKNVAFGYNENQLLMRNINFKVKAGQKVAIVGPTGAGKTTLVNLLMRFYDINDGCIEIDGIDIRKMSKGRLRQCFGMVLQDPWLFEGSIEDNIGYGMKERNSEKIIASAKAANAHQFIKTLPQGYQMILSKGAENISQGERQLLTIARAIAADSPIMILDEATSNIDTYTEMLIQNAMDELMKNRTSFIIAHRLSTIKNADMILYMENGDIKEMGTHEELLSKNGKYAALYESQFN